MCLLVFQDPDTLCHRYDVDSRDTGEYVGLPFLQHLQAVGLFCAVCSGSDGGEGGKVFGRHETTIQRGYNLLYRQCNDIHCFLDVLDAHGVTEVKGVDLPDT